MVHYIAKPRQDFIEKVGKLDMITEGHSLFAILTDTYRFPKSRESIEEYTIRVPEQIVEFKLKTKLDKNIFDFLVNYWEIEEK